MSDCRLPRLPFASDNRELGNRDPWRTPRFQGKDLRAVLRWEFVQPAQRDE